MTKPVRRKPPTKRRPLAKNRGQSPATTLVKREVAALSKKEQGSIQRPVREKVINSELQLLLKGHGIQASQLADQLAKQESAMIEFIGKNKEVDHGKLLSIASRLEAIRRSATEDLRLTVRTLEELKYPPVALAAVLGADQRAFYASGSSRILGNARVQSDED